MADELEEVQEKVPEVVPEVTPTEAKLEPAQMAELLKQFTEAGNQEPHDLVAAVEKRANQMAQNLVQDLLDKRQQDWEITNLAAKFTGGGRYGLPVKVTELADFLQSLDQNQFDRAKALFEDITKSGVVEFEEVGHGRRMLRQPLPEHYRESLEAAIAAGHTVAEFCQLAGIDPVHYDFSSYQEK